MSPKPSKPVRFGWILLFLALVAAYGLGTCQGRRQAENPEPPRWSVP